MRTLIKNNELDKEIARKIFLSYSTEIFKGNEDKEFYIKNNIAKRFSIPFSSIQIVGSSKTGISFFKDKKFEPGVSDLDIAIISAPLFIKFTEQVHLLTNSYSNLTIFSVYNGLSNAVRFKSGIVNGIVNPFIMPNCELKTQWLDFFNSLSNNHFDLFKGINGGIYLSEYYFETKQEECIIKYHCCPR